jgi:ankyrin repeat protein
VDTPDIVRGIIFNYLSLNTFILQNGNSSLHLACELGHLEVVLLLLDSGANIDAQNDVYSPSPSPLPLSQLKNHSTNALHSTKHAQEEILKLSCNCLKSEQILALEIAYVDRISLP